MLPPPFEAHFGIVPPPPPEDGVAISQAMKSLDQARGALGKIDAIAGQMEDPYIVSRILTRREAVSWSSIEGTQSTLDEILSVEKAGEGATDAARQVRNYVLALDDSGWLVSARVVEIAFVEARPIVVLALFLVCSRAASG